jgi:hypothetical protein
MAGGDHSPRIESLSLVPAVLGPGAFAPAVTNAVWLWRLGLKLHERQDRTLVHLASLRAPREIRALRIEANR